MKSVSLCTFSFSVTHFYSSSTRSHLLLTLKQSAEMTPTHPHSQQQPPTPQLHQPGQEQQSGSLSPVSVDYTYFT